MNAKKKNDGFVLTAVMMLLLIASLVGGAFLFSARNSFSTVDQWRTRDECLLGLQSGLERRKYAIDQGFRTIYNVSHSWDSLDVLGNLNVTAIEQWTNHYSTSPHVVTTTVVTTSGSVSKIASNYTATVTVTNIATATHGGITRRVREVIRYSYASAPSVGGGDGSVFDNVFFIDNVGFFSGVNADFNGDVRANQDVDLQYSSIRLNGDSYAGGENTSRKLYKNLDWDDYGSQSFSGIDFSDRVRPAEYTDYNRSNPDTYWPQGYDEEVTFYDDAEVLEMPFIGPLDEYEDYAIAAGGVVRDSSKTVAAVWGDDSGENAGIGTNDTGCLILTGTAADPINITGIVVATGDIYIQGYYTGQGTLYAGRNIYVLDNLIAVDPPVWPHSDRTPLVTAAANATKDFLGLCAKGSMVFGDYSTVDTSLLKSPHTASHATDVSDAALGYVSYYSDGIPYFNGDYTAQDASGTGTRSDGTSREFYEPMISDAAMAALGGALWVGWFDASLYANHLICGDFDSNAVLNGSFICRDEAVKRHGNLALNWDIRLGSASYDGVGFSPWLPGMLPRQSKVYHTIKWTELAP
jgi:hypothetical protein